MINDGNFNKHLHDMAKSLSKDQETKTAMRMPRIAAKVGFAIQHGLRRTGRDGKSAKRLNSAITLPIDSLQRILPMFYNSRRTWMWSLI